MVARADLVQYTRARVAIMHLLFGTNMGRQQLGFTMITAIASIIIIFVMTVTDVIMLPHMCLFDHSCAPSSFANGLSQHHLQC